VNLLHQVFDFGLVAPGAFEHSLNPRLIALGAFFFGLHHAGLWTSFGNRNRCIQPFDLLLVR